MLIVVAFGFRQSNAAEAPIDFQRDVQPILAEYCAACHGVDQEARQAGLRLDVRDDALRGGDSGQPAIVPNKPEMSELVRRLITTDPSEKMPPADQRQPTAKDIETLNQWISQGAVYESHWAFQSPVKQPIPAVGKTHPIDAFVAAKLTSMGMEPSAKADDATLCRRLYLDLIGLPPSPQELDEYKTVGFAATVEKLLQSERYGEKWARHWMDAARYSDTNGYEKDLQREQWSWRDWVINAFNQDMPYDQFIIEQMAGDLLPNPTQDQIIATGFLRNSMINEEGAIVPEQFRMVEMFDRIDCVGKAIMGLTTQCAQCHTHKFDPITHDEYFGLFAFLNNSYEAKSWVYTREQLEKIASITQTIESLENRVRETHPDWKNELLAFEDKIRSQQPAWTPIEPFIMEAISGLNHPTQEADKSILMLGHTSADIYFIAKPDVSGVTGVRFEILTHGDLPFQGPGHGRTGTWSVKEFEIFSRKPDSKEWEKIKLTNASADFSEPDQKQAEGKQATGPVSYLIDGNDGTAWQADRGIGLRNQPSIAVIQFAEPLSLVAGSELKVAFRMNDMVGCTRISLTTAPNPVAMPIDHAAILAAQIPEANRSAKEQTTLFRAWHQTLEDCKSINAEIAAQLQQYPVASTSILHLAEREPNNSRQTYLLDRGNWDQKKHAVSPHIPKAFHPLAEADGPARLQFARWIAGTRSPLTARVAVNRIWQSIFGTGLVETSEDFGTRAPIPEYKELLDWLAVDFMENRWSQKHLVRLIVSSSTYQQESTQTPESMEKDPQNRLLARGPRFRAEAEVLRDIVLSAAGLITQKVGGPSVIPPVPQNVLDYNYTYPSYWTPAQGPDRYRRSVYVFRKRSMPDPVMSAFDSPNGDFACARRVRSNTPLSALTSLNEPVFVEAAQAMALRVLREGGSDDSSRSQFAFRLCTARLPTPTELAVVRELIESRRKKLAEGWLNPREIATGDPAKLPELPTGVTPQDIAAWTLVSRVLLNMDATIVKN
jgi:Protein of unknown function (DUF1553)/Protein of unknown function (DUF1549)/Planctomycete cytochrome C